MQVYLTDGTLPTYFDNGKKSGEVTYKNSQRHGLWTEWYESGQIKSERKFKDALKNWSIALENSSNLKEKESLILAMNLALKELNK